MTLIGEVERMTSSKLGCVDILNQDLTMMILVIIMEIMMKNLIFMAMIMIIGYDYDYCDCNVDAVV